MKPDLTISQVQDSPMSVSVNEAFASLTLVLQTKEHGVVQLNLDLEEVDPLLNAIAPDESKPSPPPIVGVLAILAPVTYGLAIVLAWWIFR